MGLQKNFRFTGLFAAFLMVGLMAFTTNSASAQVHEPIDLHRTHVDTLMAELVATLTLSEQQHAQIRAILQEELDALPEDEPWTWTSEHEEFNQRVEEVLEENQRVLFREWLQTRPAITPEEFEEQQERREQPPEEVPEPEEPEQRHHHEQEKDERERPPGF